MTEKDPLVRLRLGAKVLGDFWRKGYRCVSGWATSCADEPEARTHFCKAKAQWADLASSIGRCLDEESKYGVVEAMRASEFEASSTPPMVAPTKDAA